MICRNFNHDRHLFSGRLRLFTLFLCVFLLLPAGLLGCAASDASGEISVRGTDSAAFEEFCDKLFVSEISANTINLHFTLSDPESYGITDAPVTLGNVSRTASKENNAKLENLLTVLDSFDEASLNTSQRLSLEVLTDYFQTELSASDFYLYNEFLSPSSGIQAQLPILYEEYRFYSEEDVKNYLELLPLTKTYFEQIAAFEKEKADAGLFMSNEICDSVIEQCASFGENPETHYLILSFNNKVDSVPGLSDEQRAAYKEQNAAIVQDSVFPAYDALAEALTDLKGSGKNDKGLCYFADGRDYYEYLMYYNTGCSDEIGHIQTMIGNRRLRDLTEAAALIAEEPDLWETCDSVSLDGKDAVTTLNYLKTQMQKQFPAAPDAEFTVSYIDECMEDYLAPAFYITAPIDNYDSNSIYINAQTDSTTMRYFTTLAHEGFPGHLYQTIMSYESGLSPVRTLLNYPGYVEGWATYVEMLSYQYAGLAENAASLLALNQSALLSLYASTDIGIHYDGWSLSDTIKFWSDYGISDTDAVSEIYTYIISEPANYLKYYVGYLEFLNLKDTAKEKYGSNYSDVAFHQALLDIGPAPFDLIEKYLDMYYKPED